MWQFYAQRRICKLDCVNLDQLNSMIYHQFYKLNNGQKIVTAFGDHQKISNSSFYNKTNKQTSWFLEKTLDNARKIYSYMRLFSY